MAKKILTAIAALQLAVASFAQPANYCGTPHGKSEWLKAYQQQPQAYAQRSNNLLYVPLTIHLVGTSEGEDFLSVNSLYENFCTLNEAFEAANIQFYIEGDINYISSDNYYEHNFQQGSWMMQDNNVPGTVNCYFVGDPAGNCGYYSPFRDAVAMSNGCSGGGAQTWAHELGHFFSLPHPFSGWEGTDYTPSMEVPNFLENGAAVERLDGSNCNFAGDGFCDTPADYLSFRWSCNGSGESSVLQQDPQGEEFRSDGSLIMSYSNDNCKYRFSSGQIDAMRANILSQRQELINDAPTPEPIASEVELLSPESGLALGNANTSVSLSWAPLPSADGYIVETAVVLPGTSTTINEQRHFAEATSLVVEGLVPNRDYQWRVRPLNPYDGCAPYSDPYFFSLREVVNSSRYTEEAFAFELFPNPQEAGAPIRVELESPVSSRQAVLRLYSSTGQILRQQAVPNGSGKQQLSISTEGMAAGLYLLEWRHAEGRVQRKLLLQ